jgi:hypothetical protein
MLDSILDFIYKINSFNLGIGIYIFYILFGRHIIDTYTKSNISKTKVDTNEEKKLDIKVNNQKIKFITDPNYNPYDYYDDSDEENNRLINEQNILSEMKYTQEMNEQNRIWDEYNRAKELNSYKNQSWYILGYPSERAYTNAVFSGTYLKNNNRKR